MKKKLFLLVVLALALPMAAFADDVSFTSTGGTFTGTLGIRFDQRNSDPDHWIRWHHIFRQQSGDSVFHH